TMENRFSAEKRRKRNGRIITKSIILINSTGSAGERPVDLAISKGLIGRGSAAAGDLAGSENGRKQARWSALAPRAGEAFYLTDARDSVKVKSFRFLPES